MRDMPNLVKAMKIHATCYPNNGGTVPIDRFDLAALCAALEAQWALVKDLTAKVAALEDEKQDAIWERMGEDL